MESTEPCEFLSWDTEFFGHRIARVKRNRLRAVRIALGAKCVCWAAYYSCLSASIGSSLAAFIAGNIPKKMPTQPAKPNEMAMAQAGM